MRTASLLACLILVTPAGGLHAQAPKGSEEDLVAAGWKSEVFKTIGDIELRLWILEPDGHSKGKPVPAAIFFYGGGWSGRSMVHFKPQGEYLVERGMVAVLPDYRSAKLYGGTPFDCVEDAKSAVRYVRANADRLGVDPQRLAVGGGSAGGHLAAATATLPGFNAGTDDQAVSCVPNALVLFNPVYDNGPEGYGRAEVKARYEEFSPLHNLRKGVPPTVVFLGSQDKLIPVSTAEAYEDKMKALGARCETHIYEGEGHGFFNREPHLSDAIAKMAGFLQSLGYLEAK